MAKKPDSVTHHEERHAQMREEAGENQRLAAEAETKRELNQVEREQAAVEAETKELAQYASLAQHGETREMLLDRIRKMRAMTEKPKEDDKPGFRSPQQQQQFEAEQEEGRRAVARAAAELEKNREIWRKQEEEERARKNAPATMETVHHPNPDQSQVFPTSKPR
jgi:hypothetical protein